MPSQRKPNVQQGKQRLRKYKGKGKSEANKSPNHKTKPS